MLISNLIKSDDSKKLDFDEEAFEEEVIDGGNKQFKVNFKEHDELNNLL